MVYVLLAYLLYIRVLGLIDIDFNIIPSKVFYLLIKVIRFSQVALEQV